MEQKNIKYFFFPKFVFKHSLFLFFFIAMIAKKIIKIFIEKGQTNHLIFYFFKLYVYNIGDFISLIPFLIIKYRMKKSNKIQLKPTRTNIFIDEISLIYNKTQPRMIKKCSTIVHVVLYTIFDFIAQISETIYFLLVEENDITIPHISFNSAKVIYILSTLLFSRIILKIEFYKHHYFAILVNIFCLLIISIIDIIQINDNILISIIYIIVKLSSNILYSFTNILEKIIFFYDYLTPYSLLLNKATIEFVYIAIFSIPFFFKKINIEKDEPKLIFVMFRYIFEEESEINIIKIILVIGLIIISFFYNILIFQIIDKFSPNHLVIAQTFENFGYFIIDLLEDSSDDDPFIISVEFILYILLILASVIYNEFIVINICGLAKNTQLFLNFEAANEFSNNAIIDNDVNEDDNSNNKDEELEVL